MGIPEIRTRLLELAEEMQGARHGDWASELRALAAASYRRRVKPRAPTRSRRMTPELAAEIRRIHRKNPRLSTQDIATRLGVNPGRVSEAIGGER